MKKVYIVGIGMEGRQTLTQQAQKAIDSADCLIGAERMLKPFSDISKNKLTSWDSSEISDYVMSTSFDTYAVLMSGDCGYFSGTENLLKALPEGVETEIINGISSPVYFCGKLQIPWQDIPTVNLHGETANVVRIAAMNRRCFFLLGGKLTVKNICKQLCKYGMGDIYVYIGEMLGYPQERILKGSARDFTEIDIKSLSVMMTENSYPETHIRSGIPDEEFIRGKVPMTKSEIRSLVISKLGIAPSDIVWDIGCGTGSVSVEMALQCYKGTVYSIDLNPEAIELTKQNALKFRCDNIDISLGSAPEITEHFLTPDKIFIGGSKGNLQDIISTAIRRNPKVIILITAVSLETIYEAMNGLSEHDFNVAITQASITRTKQIACHTMLSAQNPVFIIRGYPKCKD